jgi:hypothetical protein
VSVNDDAAQGVTNSAVSNGRSFCPVNIRSSLPVMGKLLVARRGLYLTVTGALSDTTNNQSATLPILPNPPAGRPGESAMEHRGRPALARPRSGRYRVRISRRSSGGQLRFHNQVRQYKRQPGILYLLAGRTTAQCQHEIEVQYQNQCNDTRPVVFTLNVAGTDNWFCPRRSKFPG